jgi:hypothetical protein
VGVGCEGAGGAGARGSGARRLLRAQQREAKGIARSPRPASLQAQRPGPPRRAPPSALPPSPPPPSATMYSRASGSSGRRCQYEGSARYFAFTAILLGWDTRGLRKKDSSLRGFQGVARGEGGSGLEDWRGRRGSPAARGVGRRGAGAGPRAPGAHARSEMCGRASSAGRASCAAPPSATAVSTRNTACVSTAGRRATPNSRASWDSSWGRVRGQEFVGGRAKARRPGRICNQQNKSAPHSAPAPAPCRSPDSGRSGGGERRARARAHPAVGVDDLGLVDVLKGRPHRGHERVRAGAAGGDEVYDVHGV